MKGESGEWEGEPEEQKREAKDQIIEMIIAGLVLHAISNVTLERFCIICGTRLVPSEGCKIKSALLCPRCDIIQAF